MKKLLWIGILLSITSLMMAQDMQSIKKMYGELTIGPSVVMVIKGISLR